MSLVTRTLTNTGQPLILPSGELIRHTRINFILSDNNGDPIDAWDSIDNSRVNGKISTKTDNNGEFTVDLWPNDRGVNPSYYLCVTDHEDIPNLLGQIPEGDLSPYSWFDFFSSVNPLDLTNPDLFTQHLLATDPHHIIPSVNAVIASITHGKSAYELALENGFIGTEAEWITSLTGSSAYQIALNNGFVGTETEWLTSLVCPNGVIDHALLSNKAWDVSGHTKGITEKTNPVGTDVIAIFDSENSFAPAYMSLANLASFLGSVPTPVAGNGYNYLPDYYFANSYFPENYI